MLVLNDVLAKPKTRRQSRNLYGGCAQLLSFGLRIGGSIHGSHICRYEVLFSGMYLVGHNKGLRACSPGVSCVTVVLHVTNVFLMPILV